MEHEKNIKELYSKMLLDISSDLSDEEIQKFMEGDSIEEQKKVAYNGYYRSIVIPIVKDALETLKNNGIAFDYGIDEKDNAGGSYSDEGTVEEGRNHKINISPGTPVTIQNNKANIDYQEVIGLLDSLFHEYRHLQQTENYKYNFKNSKEAILMAKFNAISSFLPNYYFENYSQDLKEIDATIYGMEETLRYAPAIFPNLDIGQTLTNYTNDYIEEQKDNPYSLHMWTEKYNNVEEIISELNQRKNSPIREKNLNKIFTGEMPDKTLKDKLLTDELQEKIANITDGYEIDSVIFEELVKIHPELLKDYPVLLSEYNLDGLKKVIPVNNIENNPVAKSGNSKESSPTQYEETPEKEQHSTENPEYFRTGRRFDIPDHLREAVIEENRKPIISLKESMYAFENHEGAGKTLKELVDRAARRDAERLENVRKESEKISTGIIR